jgi:hypothetical protein
MTTHRVFFAKHLEDQQEHLEYLQKLLNAQGNHIGTDYDHGLADAKLSIKDNSRVLLPLHEGQAEDCG